MPRPRRDLTGERLGRWTVLREGPPVVSKYDYGTIRTRRWYCRCDCGTERLVYQNNLVVGKDKQASCGCYQRETRLGLNVKHGHCRGGRQSTEYQTWEGLRARCTNPNDRSYPDYGGRGIGFCPEWNEFAVFLRDVGLKPAPGYTLDRIDNDGPYAPGNVRWATPKQQMNNRRVSTYLEYEGERLSLSEWSERLGIAIETLRHRLSGGWSVEKTLSTPHLYSSRLVRLPKVPPTASVLWSVYEQYFRVKEIGQKEQYRELLLAFEWGRLQGTREEAERQMEVNLSFWKEERRRLGER